jgi:hypothetical protein
VLDEEALLRAAANKEKDADKVAIYRKAVEKFASARAQYNLAVALFKSGDKAAAKAELDKCAKDADVNNFYGVLALTDNDITAAANFFAASGNATSKKNSAVVDILNGNYSAAASKLSGEKGFNAALAAVLTGNYSAAKNALDCENGCCPKCAAKCAYLSAVIAAREGNADEVKAQLEKVSADAELAARAAKDIEFAKFN